MLNALTVDVEDWYQTHDFNLDRRLWDSMEDRIVDSTMRLLEIFNTNNVKATFFVLGCVASKHPKLIKEIAAKGHEIGSHGMWHKMSSGMAPDEFRKDLLESRQLLEDLTGQQCKLFRSPSWSVTQSTLWILDILNQEGFICDSSIQPFKTPLSGMENVPHFPFRPVINGKKLDLIEFPPTVLKEGKLVLPFSGGFYMRIAPFFVISNALRQVNKTRQGMVYIHPWETDTAQPVLKKKPHIKFIHYYNLHTTVKKLDRLLKSFRFAPLGEIIKLNDYPDFYL